jgi:hypothetical protein
MTKYTLVKRQSVSQSAVLRKPRPLYFCSNGAVGFNPLDEFDYYYTSHIFDNEEQFKHHMKTCVITMESLTQYYFNMEECLTTGNAEESRRIAMLFKDLVNKAYTENDIEARIHEVYGGNDEKIGFLINRKAHFNACMARYRADIRMRKTGLL